MKGTDHFFSTSLIGAFASPLELAHEFLGKVYHIAKVS
jgi:hypothetical protein